MWASWSQFLAMGGYGLYVWGSIAMCVLVVAIESAQLTLRRKAAASAEPSNHGESSP